MNREIDLSRYEIRTDLAIEKIDSKKNIKGITSKEEIIDGIKVTDVKVLEEGSLIINKKPGKYITIEFDDVTDFNNREKVIKVFSSCFSKMLKNSGINENDSCLVIGLGNEKSTPDALGPLVINNILVTRHLFELGCASDGFRNVSAISPGVTGKTGIETSDLILNIVQTIKPDFVIVIDALASKSLERVNTTIQMTDTGIHPGSGIGNQRKEISASTIGIPVIAVGIPTVVDAVTIVSDTINYMHKHYSYTKKNINNPINRLIPGGMINYLKEEISVDESDKLKLLGYIGSLNDFEIRTLVFEVLSPIGYNLMVTPKEVDFVMEKLSDVISLGINKALHKNVNDI